MTTALPVEASLVALTLSGIVRLQLAFAQSSSPAQRQVLLAAAADLLDRTVPDQKLAPQLKAAAANPVPVLVEQRERIGAVPPGLWRAPRVRPNELGEAHYSGLRALERVLRKDTKDAAAARNAVSTWLAPAWQEYPQLREECLALWTQEPSAA